MLFRLVIVHSSVLVVVNLIGSLVALSKRGEKFSELLPKFEGAARRTDGRVYNVLDLVYKVTHLVCFVIWRGREERKEERFKERGLLDQNL